MKKVALYGRKAENEQFILLGVFRRNKAGERYIDRLNPIFTSTLVIYGTSKTYFPKKRWDVWE